jgi:methylated-DNA-[protein]-cysteine S-methyltransferase
MTRLGYYSILPSPIGELLLVSNGTALTAVYMESHKGIPLDKAGRVRDDVLLGSAREQLRAYFAGELVRFDLPLAFEGTAFQRRVWEQLRAIPFGTTISYAELARRLSQPAAVRAVGGANARNPISIVVPCHRVIGADGTLTGYGGGLERKRWLLEHESALL